MIRLTWRQLRPSALGACGALLVVAALAVLTGPDLARTWTATLAACRPSGDCTAAAAAFARTDEGLRAALGTLVTVVPGLIGVFWGAPLVAREVEAGTFPLVWTQSVTRTRWLVVKLAVIGLAGMMVTGLLSAVVTGWAAPMDDAGAAVYATFGQRDLAPVGYAALAFAIGVTAGVLVRRTVPAMALALVAFVVVRVGVTYGLRPRLIPPLHRTLALDPASTGLGSAVSPGSILNAWFNGGPSSALLPETPRMPDAWIYSLRVVDGAGRDLTDPVLNATCPGITGGGPPAAAGHVAVSQDAADRMHACVARIGATYHELVTYQPAGRYWTLQWAELAVCGVTALALGAFCVWWVRRRPIS